MNKTLKTRSDLDSSLKSNRTYLALLSRGLSTYLAKKTMEAKYTLAKLKSLPDSDLVGLEFNHLDIKNVRKGQRSSIPLNQLHQALWANRSTCCVCRTQGLAIIVHHIKPWATSHNHENSNLAVLCLEHHAQAHRKGDLEQNLTEARLVESKHKWESQVLLFDAKAILDAARLGDGSWWWFNHQRLFELARNLELDLTRLSNFKNAATNGWVDQNGSLADGNLTGNFRYAGMSGHSVSGYVEEVLERVLIRNNIFDVTDQLDVSILSSVISVGDVLYVQGKHYFKKLNNQMEGPGQATFVKRVANGVCISFTIDRWDAVATSPWACWLSGTNRAGSLVRVVDVEKAGSKLHLKCTGLAIGWQLQEFGKRSYGNQSWPEPTEKDTIEELT